MERDPVSIEVLRSPGLSQLSLTGMPDAWLRDSRDKIRSLVSRHVPWGPLDRVLVHLLPAEEAKSGAHLEFPIVVACMLALLRESPPPAVTEFLATHRLVGAVSLAGELQSTDLSRILERSDPEGTVGPARFASLDAFWDFLRRAETEGLVLPPPAEDSLPPETEPDPDVLPVRGRAWQRFWMLAAAVAEQPVLLVGPPGAGKSHLARWAHALVPEPDAPTAAEIRHIWTLAEQPRRPRIPRVHPHSRANVFEFLGQLRKKVARPGFFSLAHGGVLVLDEFAELNRDCREILRTVLDRREIECQQGGHYSRWPADFWLVATVNPCPCGYLRGEASAACRCSASARLLYQSRLSGPLLDRFGLKLFVDKEDGDADRTLPPHLFPIARLDAAAPELRALVSEARRRAQSLYPEELPALRAEEWTRELSERSLQNKARLRSALRALAPSASAKEISELLRRMSETEDPLISRAAPLPRLGSTFRSKPHALA